jgi:hypothetical protein
MLDPIDGIQEICIKMVKDKGYPYHMKSPFCDDYKKTHENCFACESWEGCDMVVCLMMVFSRCAAFPGRWDEADNLRDIDLILEGKKDEVDYC